MSARIAIIQGHPDPSGTHLCHALAQAYMRGATDAGHELRTVDVARLDFPLLRRARDWQNAAPPAAIGGAQQTIEWAEHLVIFFPLWLGDMPALLKGFFEQALRPGFALGKAAQGRLPKKLLKGRSARIVVTMGMPALFYRLYYRGHSVKSLKRNILEFCGIGPVRTSLIGTVDSEALGERELWLAKMAALGGDAT
jgi:putative NADPH-quinone reductase